MISNREDTLVIVEFLKSIKSRVGDLKAEYFMSDEAEQFFNAWQGVFGKKEVKTKKLLCSWHVDRSWRRSLQLSTLSFSTSTVENERVEIYHHLRTLLEANNTSEFQLLLQHFITWLHNKSYDDFCNYFQLHYCKRVEEWAFCWELDCMSVQLWSSKNKYLIFCRRQKPLEPVNSDKSAKSQDEKAVLAVNIAACSADKMKATDENMENAVAPLPS